MFFSAKYITSFALSALIILLFSSCFHNDSGCENCDTYDTCTQGNNMSDIQMSGLIDVTSVSPVLNITWNTGTEKGAFLPETYFEQVQLSVLTNPEISALTESVTYSNTQAITIVFLDLADYLANNAAIQLTLSFPDRAAYIDCSHSGTADLYLLQISMLFTTNNTLENIEFSQSIRYGAL